MPLDDPARTRSLLAEHRSDGEDVLHAARLVGDEDDYSIWRQSRRVWLAATADVLCSHFPTETLELDPVDPVNSAGADWKRQYDSELRTVREGLRLLDTLAERIQTSSLAGDPVGR
jgi:hypothetical protein